MPRLGGRTSGKQAPALPGAARQGLCQPGGQLRAAHRGPYENRSGVGPAGLPFRAYGETIMNKQFLIGMDVGSTTVKAVVIDGATDQILWSDYQRHDTKQPEKVLEFCKRFDTEVEGF